MKSTALLIVTLFSALNASADTQMYFIHNDHLGTPQVVTDDNQQVVWEGNKKPFGETEETTATIDQQARFPGQYFDEESRLYYNYYRDYDPSLGRYIQGDPIGINMDFSGPQFQVAIKTGVPLLNGLGGIGLNHLYGYAMQSPLNAIDFFGLFAGCRPMGNGVWDCDDGPDYNDGNDSAFPGSMNDSCVKKCMNKKVKDCASLIDPSSSKKDLRLVAACVVAVPISCSNQTCDKCDEEFK